MPAICSGKSSVNRRERRCALSGARIWSKALVLSDADPGEVQRRGDETARGVAEPVENLVADRRAQIEGEATMFSNSKGAPPQGGAPLL